MMALTVAQLRAQLARYPDDTWVLACTGGEVLDVHTLETAGQTASEHCLPQCGIKPIVLDARKY
jgi:hypothetical protein